MDLRTMTVAAFSCACVLSAAAAQAQLSISLDDNDVRLQNGNQAPLVVKPGQSFGGTLTPQGFQGVMSDSRGPKMVKPAMNPFRDAAPAAAPQGFQIQAGNVSIALPGAKAPNAMAMRPMPRQKFLAVREMVRTKSAAMMLPQVDRLVKDYAADADLLQLRAVLLLQQNDEREAAACVYDAMAMGPAWDWTMLKTAFPDPAAATQMYRHMQEMARDKPSMQRDFLLAWFERMLAHPAEAARAMQRVASAQPREPLFARLRDEWRMPEEDMPPAP